MPESPPRIRPYFSGNATIGSGFQDRYNIKFAGDTRALAVLSSAQHSSGEGSKETVSGSWCCRHTKTKTCSLFD
jgi:hypothetical protein